MSLFQNLTNDQLALGGCALALGLSASIMYFSYYLGKMNQRSQRHPGLRRMVRETVSGRPLPLQPAPEARQSEKAA